MPLLSPWSPRHVTHVASTWRVWWRFGSIGRTPLARPSRSSSGPLPAGSARRWPRRAISSAHSTLPPDPMSADRCRKSHGNHPGWECPKPSRSPRIVAGIALGIAFSPLPLRAQTAYEQLQAFSGVLSQVRTNYVDSVDLARLIQASIRGMLSSLDPHSRYVTREEFERRMQWDQGELAAPGMELDDAGRVVTVLAVEPGGPAARAGVQAGDRVVRINDSSVAGLGARAIEVRLYGEKGTKVRMTFERGSLAEPDTLAVTLKRTLLKPHDVSTPRMADSSTGYLRLAEFTAPATKELSDAVDALRKMGATQLILDLRGN